MVWKGPVRLTARTRVPLGLVDLLEARSASDAGGVAQYVDPAEPAAAASDRRAHRRHVGDVAAPAVGAPPLLRLRQGLVQAVAVDVDGEHLRALGGEELRRRTADARGRHRSRTPPCRGIVSCTVSSTLLRPGRRSQASRASRSVCSKTAVDVLVRRARHRLASGSPPGSRRSPPRWSDRVIPMFTDTPVATTVRTPRLRRSGPARCRGTA